MQLCEKNSSYQSLHSLETIIQKKQFSRPFLLQGSKESHLEATANEFAKQVLEEISFDRKLSEKKLQDLSHPDLLIYRPEGKAHLYTMETIQSIISQASLGPHESSHKVFLLLDIDRMLPIHANALLKTLEEKKEEIIFILTTEKFGEILPTICSRVFSIYIEPKAEYIALPNTLEILIKEAFNYAEKDAYEGLFQCLEKIEKELGESEGNELFFALCDFLLNLVKSTHPKQPLENLIHHIEEGKIARKHHIRPKHILENLLLSCYSR